MQFLQPPLSDQFRDPGAIAILSFMGAGSSAADDMGFDEAERWHVAQVRRNDGVMRLPSGGVSSLSMTVGSPMSASRRHAISVPSVTDTSSA